MADIRWISKTALCLLHDETLAIHGGSAGLRDEGLLESALARPENRHHYENSDDVFALATNYAYGIAKNHPFVDGNKRAAFAAAGLFLSMNGYQLTADKIEAYHQMIALAAGKITEEAYAEFLRANVRARKK